MKYLLLACLTICLIIYCVTAQDCPPGVSVPSCTSIPCVAQSCPKFPEATCQNYLCGGCHAIFALEGNVIPRFACPLTSEWPDCLRTMRCEITEKCRSQCPAITDAECNPSCDCEAIFSHPITGRVFSETECFGGCSPSNLPVRCKTAPCDVESCPGHPNATCTNNYCGGCNAIFRDNEGNVIPKFACAEDNRWPQCLQVIRCAAPPITCATGCPGVKDAVCNRNCVCGLTFTDKQTGNILTQEQCDPGCPDDEPFVHCAAEPCEIQACMGVADATCTNNYCGECKAVFTDDNGKVLSEMHCMVSTQCPGNQIFSSCGGHCLHSCEDAMAGRRLFCTTVCTPGCTCPNNTFWNGSLCLTEEECRATTVQVCPGNQIRSTCGGCVQECEAIDTDPEPCPEICRIGCTCPPHTYLQGNNCVTEQECRDNACSGNQVFSQCQGHCRHSCKAVLSGRLLICRSACLSGCTCPSNTFYNGTSCITREECLFQARTCPSNQIYSQCDGRCLSRCENVDNPKVCPAICAPGCTCPRSTYWSGDRCVTADDCRKTTNGCPSGKPLTNCTAAPCDVEVCLGRHDATCTNNHCGGCHAVFTDNEGNVIPKFACVQGVNWPICLASRRCSSLGNRCKTECPAVPDARCLQDCSCGIMFTDPDTGNILSHNDCGAGCPTGVNRMRCYRAPCDSETCHGHPDATCSNYYCGGCHAVFRDSRGMIIPKFACAGDVDWPVCLALITCPSESDPCERGCPAVPDARCVINCRCTAVYVDRKTGNLLSHQDCGMQAMCPDLTYQVSSRSFTVSCTKGRTSGSRCRARCPRGYRRYGRSEVLCKPNGEWNTNFETTQCVRRFACPPRLPRRRCKKPICKRARCPRYADAVCVERRCGSCGFDFYRQERRLTRRECLPRQTCRVTLFNRFCGSAFNPCRLLSCGRRRKAVCRRSCNCMAKFYDNVTLRRISCRAGR